MLFPSSRIKGSISISKVPDTADEPVVTVAVTVSLSVPESQDGITRMSAIMLVSSTTSSGNANTAVVGSRVSVEVN